MLHPLDCQNVDRSDKQLNFVPDLESHLLQGPDGDNRAHHRLCRCPSSTSACEVSPTWSRAHLVSVNLNSSPRSSTCTTQPSFSAARRTFSREVTVSTKTSMGNFPAWMALRARMTGWGQDSPRASTVSATGLPLHFLTHGQTKNDTHHQPQNDRSHSIGIDAANLLHAFHHRVR